MEAFGHDHVEETMGYKHTVEGMSLYHFCADTTKEIEGNELFAHVGPNIKRKRLYSRSLKAL